jgi:hypothetical protein
MRFVVIALLVLGSIFGPIAVLLFLPELSSNLAYPHSDSYSHESTQAVIDTARPITRPITRL